MIAHLLHKEFEENFLSYGMVIRPTNMGFPAYPRRA